MNPRAIASWVDLRRGGNNGADLNFQISEGFRAHGLIRPVRRHTGIAVRASASVNLDGALRQIHDPIFRDAGPGIEPRLDEAVLAEGIVSDFYDEERVAGVRTRVVAWRYERDVGLRLGVVAESERALNLDERALSHRSREQHGELPYGVRMTRSLRAHLDEQAVNELDPLILEQAEIDEAIILATPESTYSQDRQIAHLIRIPSPGHPYSPQPGSASSA